MPHSPSWSLFINTKYHREVALHCWILLNVQSHPVRHCLPAELKVPGNSLCQIIPRPYSHINVQESLAWILVDVGDGDVKLLSNNLTVSLLRFTRNVSDICKNNTLYLIFSVTISMVSLLSLRFMSSLSVMIFQPIRPVRDFRMTNVTHSPLTGSPLPGLWWLKLITFCSTHSTFNLHFYRIKSL